MKVDIVDFSTQYVKGFIYDGIEREHMGSDEEIRQEIIDRAKISPYCKVCLVNEEPIFFAGVFMISPHVGESWLFFNNVPAIFSRYVMQVNYEAAEQLKLVRMQAACLDNPKLERFLQFLGYEYEATLRRYYNGELDVKIYSIIFGR